MKTFVRTKDSKYIVILITTFSASELFNCILLQHNKRRKLLAMLENGRHKRNCRPGHFSVAGRNLTILVPFAVNLMYEGGRLTFHDDVTGEPVDFTDNKL